jgi:hypothetical protein
VAWCTRLGTRLLTRSPPMSGRRPWRFSRTDGRRPSWTAREHSLGGTTMRWHCVWSNRDSTAFRSLTSLPSSVSERSSVCARCINSSMFKFIVHSEWAKSELAPVDRPARSEVFESSTAPSPVPQLATSARAPSVHPIAPVRGTSAVTIESAPNKSDLWRWNRATTHWPDATAASRAVRPVATVSASGLHMRLPCDRRARGMPVGAQVCRWKRVASARRA